MTDNLIKCLLTDVPVAPIIKRLEDPELWTENTWRQDYVVQLERPVSPQQDTEAVMFRWAPENTIESVRDSIDVRVCPNYYIIQEIQPLLLMCLQAANALELGRTFVAKLKPGGRVIPHMDYGMYADRFERFHLVLSSEPGNQFFVQDKDGRTESTYMKPGEFYWFDHKSTHWALNDSTAPRMHLILDAVAPTFRRERV